MQTEVQGLDRYSMAILKLLASNPLRSYYQREIARDTGVSVGKTNQVLRGLESKEFATRERKGNVDFYRYNLASPAARYLKIFFNLSELEDLLRKLMRVSDKVILFGSFAEGTDSAESDVDLLVVTGQKEEAGRILSRTRGSIDRKVSPVILTALEFSQLKAKDPAFYAQVSTGITLWQNEED